MPVRIRLLGKPSLERDGSTTRLDGRKTWALLAFVILESPAPTRRSIVERLWADADDPLAAMRWTLSQVRKALAPDATIGEESEQLALTGGFSVDAVDLLNGDWGDDTIDAVTRGELLESSDASDTPDFERWLSVQRARVATARTDALRATAAACLRSDPLRALRLAERALASEPFDDALHELVVEIHVQRGDMAEAARYVDATADLYRRELGTAAPKGLRRALDRTRISATAPLLRLDLEARALLETAMARCAAGAWDDARDVTTRAIDAAAASGDRALEARGILSFLGIATCRMSRGEAEWNPLLQRVAALGAELGDASLLCDLETERGRLAAIGGRFGTAEAMLRHALAGARALGDATRTAAALRYLGMAETERGDEIAAEADLRAAASQPPLRASAMAYLARLLALQGRYDEIEEFVDDAQLWATADALVWHPLAIIASGDGWLARGDLARAADRFGSALTFARETQDPDWTSLALRGLAHVDLRDGRPERAATMFRQALDVVMTHLGARRWNEALLLGDLVEVEGGADRAHVERGLHLVRTAPMPRLEPRFMRFAQPERSHTLLHTVAS